MRICLLPLFCTLLGVGTLLPAHARTQDDPINTTQASAPQASATPYSTTVPVLDTSDAQRDHAFAVALGQVLGQVGGKDLSTKAGYTDAVVSAPSYVQQFQYQRAASGAATPFTLTVSFDPTAIRRLVANMGTPVWSGPTSPVLLVVRGANGMRLDATALGPLIQATGPRGINTIVANGAPDIGALARADREALADVAQRYHTGLVLLGTLGNGNAVWTLVAAGKVTQWSDRVEGADAQLTAAGNSLVEHLMQQFGATAGGGGRFALWVGNVDSGVDFARLLAILRGNASINSAQVSMAQGNGVLLDITTRTPLQAVVNDLGAGGRLLPAATAHAGADATLRWLN